MKRIILLFSLSILGAVPVKAASEVCIATGDNLHGAKSAYASSCDIPVKDCDPFDGVWYCASQRIDSKVLNQFSNYAGSRDSGPTNNSVHSNENLCIDTDGDGWGWDGSGSCRVSNPSISKSTTAVESGNLSAVNFCVDSDGDGWGWNGTSSCRLTSPNRRVATTVNSDFNSVGANSIVQEQCGGDHPNDITDLILVTGQSNVTGANTEVSATLDRWGRVSEFNGPDKPHSRVFAWTVDPHSGNAGAGWKVASLTQSWHDKNPGVGGVAHNNFAFHFAKKVAEKDSCRVVGLIVVSEAGRGISHWDYSAPGWNEVVRQVNDAMSAIGRTSIDGILWHQGESDWIANGTCYKVERCQNNHPDYYAQKLYSRIADPSVPNHIGRFALIDRLRRADWFGSGKPFIAGETAKAPVNSVLNKLNTDNDRWTATINSDAASGIETRSDDIAGIHFSATGLRELGARYAYAYLNLTAP